MTDFERKLGKAIGLRWKYSEYAERYQWTVYPSFDQRTLPARIVEALEAGTQAWLSSRYSDGPANFRAAFLDALEESK